MACLECRLEQAVADAGICARCGAPLTGRGGAELPADSPGITTAGSGPQARARLLSWDEIVWFRDGWLSAGSRTSGWVLHAVLADGRVEAVTETWTAGTSKATPEMLAMIRHAAAAHSIPAVLTGGRVHDGLPGKDAGLYYDPAGEPGLREWTGTEWSSFLQVDPGASGQPRQETGLATIWSPLSAAELHRQSRAVLREARTMTTIVTMLNGGGALFLMLMAGLNAGGLGGVPRNLWWAALLAALGVLFLVFTVAGVQGFRLDRRIALALRADAIRASSRDDPPASTAPPDLRTS